MKLSIITVNFNNRDGLKKTIDSVVSQTFRDFEWIVIDGGSTDGSRELIEEYSEHFAYWCSEPDKGIYNAMNKGVAHATGEYCQFLNSGDELGSPSVLDDISNYLFDTGFLYGDTILINPDGTEIQENAPDNLSFYFMHYGNICHQSSVILTSLLKSYKYREDLIINSDWYFNVTCMLNHVSFKHIPIKLSKFHKDGISSTNLDLVYSEKNKLINELYPKALQEDVRVIKCAKEHLAHMSLEQFCNVCEKHKMLSKFITMVLLMMKKS